MMHLPIAGIVGGASIPAALFLDNFTDPDNTLLTAHTPDIGGMWNNGSGTTPKIISNRVSAVTIGAKEWRTPTLAADGVLTFVGKAGSSSNAGPTFRTTTGGYLDGWLIWLTFTGEVILYSYGTSMGTIGTGYSYAADHEIKVELVGPSIKIYINGVLKDSRIDGTNQTVATHGFRMYGSSTSIDSYRFDS